MTLQHPIRRLPSTGAAAPSRFAVSRRTLIAGLAAGVGLLASPATAAEVVNIYTYREPALIKPLLAEFTKATGIETHLIYGQDGLIERVAAEGANSPADVVLTVDIGRLADAKAKGISQPIASKAVEAAVPARYRDGEGHWVALSQRARVIFASKARVAQDTITYADLADPKWKGRVCMRSGQHTYNIGLLASMIAREGAAKAEAWARGVKANLARKPAGGDRDQAKAIFAGECDLAVANTYYMAAMLENTKNPEQKQWAASIKLLFPDAQGKGTHVNISGAVLARHAPHKANGVRLIEFLASAQGQRLYAERVNEYPLTPGIAPSKMVASWGKLVPEQVPFEAIAAHRKQASEIMDKVAFDAGPGT